MKHEPIYLQLSFVQLIPLDSPSPLSVLPIYARVDAIHDRQPQGTAPSLIHTLENGIYDGLIQYIPLNTGFDRQMLAPYSSYSAFVWQA